MAVMASFMTSQGKNAVLEHLAASAGKLSMADLEEMLDMSQIATCHETGERCTRQVGGYVELGGVLRLVGGRAGRDRR